MSFISDDVWNDIFTSWIAEDKELLLVKKERDELKEDLQQMRQQMNQVLAENHSLQMALNKMKEEKERERSSRGFSLPKFPLP